MPEHSEPIQKCVVVNAIPTNLLCQEFEDKYLMIVTQHRKLGTLTLVTEDAALPHSDNVKTYTMQVVLGADNEVTQVIARQFAQTCKVKKPVLVASALKDSSREVVKLICAELDQLQHAESAVSS